MTFKVGDKVVTQVHDPDCGAEEGVEGEVLKVDNDLVLVRFPVGVINGHGRYNAEWWFKAIDLTLVQDTVPVESEGTPVSPVDHLEAAKKSLLALMAQYVQNEDLRSVGILGGLIEELHNTRTAIYGTRLTDL